MLPSTLPLALDSYRFLGGGQTEDKYVIFTENFSLNDDESTNYFKIGPLPNADMYIRAYIEDSTIGFELSCDGSKDPKKKVLPSLAGAVIMEDLP